MIHVNCEIPRSVAIAVSGGVDSMAALDFLRRTRDVTVLHYNHGTGRHADDATSLVREYCTRFNIKYFEGSNEEEMPKGVSAEAWWREKRYAWFESCVIPVTIPIITAHHLGDVVENWIFTSLNGNPFLIPKARDQYLRPFLTTEKADFINWCKRKDVSFVEDASNTSVIHRRNYIRHVMMPHVEYINPGIKKTIKKKLLKM